MAKLSKEFITVTPLSKLFALLLFILLPIIALFIGYKLGFEDGLFAKSLNNNPLPITSGKY